MPNRYQETARWGMKKIADKSPLDLNGEGGVG